MGEKHYAIAIIMLCISIFYLLIKVNIRGAQLKEAREQVRVEVVTDTLIVHDTTHIEHFREVTKMITDTMYLVKTKVVTVHDKEYIPVPKETITVKDPQFTAQISGFNPSLDWIDIYSQTQVITRTETKYEPPKRWSFGAALGPSALVTPNGKLYGGLGITAGVQYRF